MVFKLDRHATYARKVSGRDGGPDRPTPANLLEPTRTQSYSVGSWLRPERESHAEKH
jgi:hypothetical protein